MSDPATQTIVVTGASSGIGRELALQLAAPGRELWLVARNVARLEDVAASVRAAGAIARVISLDLTDTTAAARFLDAEMAGQRIDQIYLAAAISLYGEVHHVRLEDWDRLYRTILLSTLQWAHAAYANMVPRRAGRIVIIGSLSGITGYPTATPYASLKAGLGGFFRSLRHEAGTYDIDVHLVSPGYVNTDIFRSAIYRDSDYESTMKQISALGFPMMQPAAAAKEILKGISRGKKEIVFPGYARLCAWFANRLSWSVYPVYTKILREFRKLP